MDTTTAVPTTAVGQSRGGDVYTEHQVASLIDRIYDAMVDTAQWPAFLNALAGMLGGMLPTLFLHDTRAHSGSLMVNVGFDQATVNNYTSYYAAKNVWLRTGSHLLTPGRVRTSHMMCSRRNLLRSEWYSGFCRPLGISQGIGATIFKGASLTSNIAVFGGPGRAEFGPEDIALVEALVPHLQRAHRVHTHSIHQETREHSFIEALNGLSVSVMLVAASGQVVFLNRAAQQIIDAQDGLVLRSGALAAQRSQETVRLRTLISGAAAAGRPDNRGGSIHISRSGNRPPLELLIAPICQGEAASVTERPVATIYITDPSHVSCAAEASLIRAHGLTHAEAKVAALIARGRSGTEAAEELSISYNTVKTHLRRVFAKTNTARQGELIRLLARNTAHLEAPAES